MARKIRKTTVITGADITSAGPSRSIDLFPSDHVVRIRTLNDVFALSGYLHRFHRDRPLVLMTIPKRMQRPVVDPDRIRAEFDVDVAVLDPGWLNREFSGHIGENRSAFNGASRIYPSDSRWLEGDPDLAKLLRNSRKFDRKEYGRMLRNLIREQLASERRARSAQMFTVLTGKVDVQNDAPAVDAASDASTTSSATPTVASTAGVDDRQLVWNGSPHDEADGLVHIVSEGDIEEFAAWLMSDRRMPTVVATRRSHPNPKTCAVDTTDLAGRLNGYASVVEVENPNACQALETLLPPGTHVYGGALRLYPASRNWVDRSILLRGPYTAYTEKEGFAKLPRIVDDAIGMFARQYALSGTPSQSDIAITAAVIGVCAGRGIAEYQGVPISIALPEEVQELPADRVLAKGQQVQGTYNPTLRMLAGLTVRDGRQAIAGYHDGQTVLGRVDKVRRDYCRVSLYPGMPVTVRIEDAYGSRFDDDDMRTMIGEHAVIPMRIVRRGTNDTDWTISFQDLDMDHIQPAPALIEGGPSWLQPEDLQPVEETSAAQSVVLIDKDTDIRSLVPESADPDSADMIMTLAAQIRDLQDRNDVLTREKAKLGRQRRDSERKMNDLRLRIAHLSGQYHTMRKGRHGMRLFADDAERMRCEAARFDAWIREAWALGLSVDDKRRMPLPAVWHYTEGFFDTLANTPVDRNLVVQAAVDVLIGRAASLKSYQLHRLRVSEHKGAPYRKGPNGERVWRLDLTNDTSAARRMHYYDGDNGLITFTFVGLHDDKFSD